MRRSLSALDAGERRVERGDRAAFCWRRRGHSKQDLRETYGFRTDFTESRAVSSRPWKTSDPRHRSAATEIPLPPERAFVVQLRPLTYPTGELFVGRIEHIASGTVFRFGSAAEPTDFIARICDPRFQSAKTSRPAASRRTHSDGSR